MARMDAALKAALKMPPRKHKDEKKGQIRDKFNNRLKHSTKTGSR